MTSTNARPSGAGHVVVTYRRGNGVPNWQARNRQSPVPGRWPYGLDQLMPKSVLVDCEVSELSALRTKSAAAFGIRRSAARPGDPAVALCWDEMTAVPMLAGVRAGRYYSGVIWATDAVAAGQDNSQLRLTAKVLKSMDGLWVLSRPQADRVRQWLGSGCPPVHFLRFGIDPDFYVERPYPQRPHVVSVGGDRDRDPVTLFAALAIIRSRRPEVACTVQSNSAISPPEGVNTVARLPHEQVSELLGQASVVAIATRPNLHASGMTVGLEAMATGRPVVVCDTPGMRDYFEQDATAAFVSTGDPEAMAEQILALIADPVGAAALGAAGRRVVLAEHTTRTMCDGLLDIVGLGERT